MLSLKLIGVVVVVVVVVGGGGSVFIFVVVRNFPCSVQVLLELFLRVERVAAAGAMERLRSLVLLMGATDAAVSASDGATDAAVSALIGRQTQQ
jgi:hypothetical protein